jgi:hypothetical protein
VLYRVKDRLRRAQFRYKCRGILDVQPIAFDSSSPAIVFSQLPHKDLIMFLVALRSFVRYAPIKGVHLLNDGSVTAEDKALLYEQIPGLIFHELADFRSAACPSGGCWERLLGIADLVRDHYVIQLDSDTLAISVIDEVVECVRSDTSFTLGTWDRQMFEAMSDRAGQAKEIIAGEGNSHIQVLAEANLDKLSGYESLRYVRGCAGFAGFAARSFSRERIESLSQEMYAAIGAKWNTWGSEQFASNVIVANSDRAAVLPHPKYCACNRVQAETSFIHFIGGCRFKDGTYARLGKRVIGELNGRE